jgi:lipoprotein-anchoring transpeptidase ErfK/SrfK
MVSAIEYRAMALQHHRWAGMCRSPESREEHFRLEEELLALAESEDRSHRLRVREQASNPQQSKIAPVKQVAPWPRWKPVRHPGRAK